MFTKKSLLIALSAIGFAAATLAAEKTPIPKPDTDREDWVALFNGRDLSGWTPKITGYPFGENYGNTYRAEKA